VVGDFAKMALTRVSVIRFDES